MKFSVVLLVYIGKPSAIPMTYKCIKLAREKTKIDYELVIVETCSEYFKGYCDVHIYEKNRTTPTISCNRGLRAARGEFVVLLTNDVYVEEGWLERLYECFEKHSDCGASTLASTQFNHSIENKIEEGNWFSVAMLPKKLLDRLGYMDEEFTGVFDDTDLLMRMYKLGYKMYRNFNCVVEHLIRATRGDDTENFIKNRILYNKKHEGCELEFFKQTR